MNVNFSIPLAEYDALTSAFQTAMQPYVAPIDLSVEEVEVMLDPFDPKTRNIAVILTAFGPVMDQDEVLAHSGEINLTNLNKRIGNMHNKIRFDARRRGEKAITLIKWVDGVGYMSPVTHQSLMTVLVEEVTKFWADRKRAA